MADRERGNEFMAGAGLMTDEQERQANETSAGDASSTGVDEVLESINPMLASVAGHAEAKPRVIAVMPAYNAEATLEKTIADIPRGTVDEIILVDDCSTDGTVELAKKLGLTGRRATRTRWSETPTTS
jgi:hypothetical protein